MGIAKEAAERLQQLVVLQNQGSYLLGSTAPDVRIITGASREETHFFNLVDDSFGSSVDGFLERHPNLCEVANLSAPTQAFVSGYVSHLVTDEVWICDVYRPFFGRGSALADDPQANILDRALQYELDRRERADGQKMSTFQALLADSDAGIELDFIDAALLHRWREFICTAVGREPSWDRFPIFASRFLVGESKVEPEQVEAFLASIRSKLQSLLDQVGSEQLEAFRERSIVESVKAAREYFG